MDNQEPLYLRPMEYVRDAERAHSYLFWYKKR